MHPNHPLRSLLVSTLVLFGLAVTGCDNETTLNPASPQAERARFESALEAAIETETDFVRPHFARINQISGPTVITQSGVYAVVEDFSVPGGIGDGIVIRADHVFLIVGDHVLTGPGDMEGRGIVLDSVEHVLVIGGTLRSFGTGVALLGTGFSAVRDVEVEGGDAMASPPDIPPQIGILLINSHQNRIQRNLCGRVNLGIFVRGGGTHQNLIQRNSVIGDEHGLLGICYNPAPGEGVAGPTRDDVTHNLLDRFGTGIQTSAGSAGNSFRFNTIRYFEQAWQDFNGTNEFLHNEAVQIPHPSL